MIIVKNRELLIPENERYIGTTYDDNSTVRTFRIPRFHEDGMDKSQLDFYVIINYDDGSDPDAVGVTKSVSDDYIVLEWDVGEDITEHSGCLFLWVRGFDHTGAVRWSSFPGVFYIEGSGTEPSDLSDLEQRISEEDKLLRLAKLYKSQPMTAATVAEMKHRDRIYVYVGSEAGYTYGNWYFWDEDQMAWVSGGVYNSVGIETDKTLTLEDFAADAKVVGQKTGWFVTPDMYGAKGDGVTDDSAAFQAAVDTGKTVFVPAGEYLVHDVTITDDISIIGCDGTIIHPKYVNDIAQNVFTFSGDFGRIENIVFSGDPQSGYDTSVKRQSTVYAESMECFMLKNVTFKDIDNSETAGESQLLLRKAITLTTSGVKRVLLDHVTWDGNSRDEAVYILPSAFNKIDEVFVEIDHCHSKNHGGWSIINVIANTVSIYRFVSESTDDTNGASYMNLLCRNIIVKESKFYGSYHEIIDNRESDVFFGDSVLIEDCYLDGFTTTACILYAKQIVIKRCYCHGRALLHYTNTCATDSAIIALFGDIAYSTYKPIEKITVEDCEFDADISVSSIAWASFVYVLSVGGCVHLNRNRFDMNNITGSALYLSDVEYLSVEECEFKNGSNILGSSSISAYAEIKNNVKNILYRANTADHMLAAIMGTGNKKIILKDNNIPSTFTGNIIDNFGTSYKCEVAETDTNQVRIYCDAYTTTNASYSEASWSATSSSAYGTELTDRLSLKRGVYFVTCSLPTFSSSMPVRFRNFTGSQDFGGVVMAGSYGTISAVFSANADCEIGLITQGSASVTITNYSNSKITAIPIKF